MTRNNSIDCNEYKTNVNLQKKQIFDAVAASSIVDNCSGVETSKSQVITLATFTKFLESRQQEKLSDENIKALIKVDVLPGRKKIINYLRSRRAVAAKLIFYIASQTDAINVFALNFPSKTRPKTMSDPFLSTPTGSVAFRTIVISIYLCPETEHRATSSLARASQYARDHM